MYKIVLGYLVLIVGTLANLVFWTDSRPAPLWMSFLATAESLAVLNIWLGRFISKRFWEQSLRPSFGIVIALLLLRLLMVPFAVAP